MAVGGEVCALVLISLYAGVRWDAMRPLFGHRSILRAPSRDHIQRIRAEHRQAIDDIAELARHIEPGTVALRVRFEYLFHWRLLRDLPDAPRFSHPLAKADRPTLRPWPAPDLAVIETGHFADSLRDASSGEVLYEVMERDRFRVFVSEAAARRLHARGFLDELPEGLRP
jgi:hypothetical protein